jgi:catalase
MKRIAFSIAGLVVFGAIIGLSVSAGLAEPTAVLRVPNAEKLAALKRLIALRMERRDALQEAAKTAEKGYRAGVMDYKSMKRINIELLNAELDLAMDRPGRVAVRERLVEQFKKIEKEFAERVAVAQASSTDLLEAKAARLKAEIDLLLESTDEKRPE